MFKMRKMQKVQCSLKGLLVALLILAVGDVAEEVGAEPVFEGAFAQFPFFGDLNAFGGGEGDGKVVVDFALALGELRGWLLTLLTITDPPL